MGYDLSGAGGALSLNNDNFETLLGVADRFGWRPAGTSQYYEVPKWCGTYGSNDGQRVTDADALELAKALRRAIAAKAFNVDMLEHATAFAAFCEAGGFYLY